MSLLSRLQALIAAQGASYKAVRDRIPTEGVLTVTVGQDVNDAGVIDTTVDTLSAPWSSPQSGQLQYTGTPARVRIDAHIHQAIPNNVNRQRPGPVLELYKNGALVSSSATGYIRDSNDHEESSNTLVFVDRSPGVNPVYEIRSRRDSTTGSATGAVDVVSGQFIGNGSLLP